MSGNAIRWTAIGGSALALIIFGNFFITLLAIGVMAGSVYSLGTSHSNRAISSGGAWGVIARDQMKRLK